jgi:hypothetical protein
MSDDNDFVTDDCKTGFLLLSKHFVVPFCLQRRDALLTKTASIIIITCIHLIERGM